jgi:hypothetical protein
MHMNIYVFFQILNILCIFWSTSFWSSFFPVHIFGVDQFDDRSSSNNTSQEMIQC